MFEFECSVRGRQKNPAIFDLVEVVGDLANPAIIVSVDHGPLIIFILLELCYGSFYKKILVFSLLVN